MSERTELILAIIYVIGMLYITFQIIRLGMKILALKEERKYKGFIFEYYRFGKLRNNDLFFFSAIFTSLRLMDIKPFNEEVDQHFRKKYFYELIYLLFGIGFPVIIIIIKESI